MATIKQEAATTLTVLLAGVGGALTYAVKVLEPGSAGPVAFGAAVLCVYLSVLSALLVSIVMLLGEVPQTHNEPKNLKQTQFSLDRMRDKELDNLQHRIDQYAAYNKIKARYLNLIRTLAIVSPLIFWLGAATYKPSIMEPTSIGLRLDCKAVSPLPASAPQLACNLAK